ncbi:type II toxin-antitoxin system VapC family toxin [Corynebacterium nuruki]|uniref:type II toxin-antitoxin system VapC family toxin n=1 Tax=Corynebacterium nuruki TaxID=1032851 RepID=UPI0039BF6C55
MIVVDAGALALAVLDDHATGDRVRTRLRGEILYAPDLIYPEVLSVIRRQTRARTITPHRADAAAGDLHRLPLLTAPLHSLVPRAWEFRGNVTPYDAMYIALAESLDCVLLTTDPRLSRAPGIRCVCETATDR